MILAGDNKRVAEVRENKNKEEKGLMSKIPTNITYSNR